MQGTAVGEGRGSREQLWTEVLGPTGHQGLAQDRLPPRGERTEGSRAVRIGYHCLSTADMLNTHRQLPEPLEKCVTQK